MTKYLLVLVAAVAGLVAGFSIGDREAVDTEMVENAPTPVTETSFSAIPVRLEGKIKLDPTKRCQIGRNLYRS